MINAAEGGQGVFDDFTVNVAASVFLAAVGYLLTKFWIWFVKSRRRLAAEEAFASTVVSAGTSDICTIELPPGAAVLQKLRLLKTRCRDARKAASAARRRGEDSTEAMRQAASLESDLRNMRFLAHGDRLGGRFDLIEPVGEGRQSQVWRAYDEKKKRTIAVKILRHSFAGDASVVERFFEGAQAMNELRSSCIPAIHEERGQSSDERDAGIFYYVMDYVPGTCLDQYLMEKLREHTTLGADLDFKTGLTLALIELGRSVADAHKKGIVHRDIKPGNIVVEAGGSLQLVDFDSAAQLVECRYPHRDVGTFGFSAPEVLDGRKPHDIRADIFSLARVVIYVYFGRALPDPYEMSNFDLIDYLSCPFEIKEILRRATAVQPERRHHSMAELLDELESALNKEKESPALRGTLRQVRHDRFRAGQNLRHAFYGTLAAMLVARPIFAIVAEFSQLHLVHLSDRPSVAVFHGVIGSFVWGVLITLGFLYYLEVLHREDKWGYLWAALLCGLGGFVGGIICAAPSILVTNECTLFKLGWLHESAIKGCEDNTIPGLSRLTQSLHTGMFWAFPLTGFFTGTGLGLSLNLRFKELLRKRVQGLLPMPVKKFEPGDHAAFSSIAFVLRSPLSHLFLLLPVIFSWSAYFILHAAGGDPIKLDFDQTKLVLFPSIGEGVVHYFGALGLSAGLLTGIATRLEKS